MALNLSDCDKMILVSQKAGVKLSIVHPQRFYPPFVKAQELVKNGAIGKLTDVRILTLTNKFQFMDKETHWVHALPGGIIAESGPHPIYLSLAFLKKVDDVCACAKKTLDYPWVSYDNCKIELRGGDLDSSIILSHASNCSALDVDLIGTEGTIRLDLQSMLLILNKQKDFKQLSRGFYSLGVSLSLSSLEVANQIVKGVISNAFAAVRRKKMLGHRIVIERFVNSVVNDQPVPVPAEEGRETCRIIEMIVRKLDQHGDLGSRAEERACHLNSSATCP